MSVATNVGNSAVLTHSLVMAAQSVVVPKLTASLREQILRDAPPSNILSAVLVTEVLEVVPGLEGTSSLRSQLLVH